MTEPWNIEHEDVLVNSVEGVTRAAEMLKRVAWSNRQTGSPQISDLNPR